MQTVGEKIGFIGAGHMAEALISGLTASGPATAGSLLAHDVQPGRLADMAGRFGLATPGSNARVAEQADVLVIAVKPKDLASALRDVAGSPAPACRIISIVAGATTRRIEEALGGTPAVVLAMPNTPCLIRQGVTAIAPGRWAGAEVLARARALFDAVGVTVTVEEGRMDAVTAVSGSGPAYVFLLMELLGHGAVELGLDAATARRLVREMAAGAARMAQTSGLEPAVLRQRVTSPGGTTEAALAVMAERGLPRLIGDALKAAARRSAELSRG